MKKEYMRNVVCTHCNGTVVVNALHQARGCMSLYEVCPHCGGRKLYDSIEYWHSTAIWYLPWTWCNGYWVNHVGVRRNNEGEQQ